MHSSYSTRLLSQHSGATSVASQNQIPSENSTPMSMSLADFTIFENCTAFSAALCRSSMEKIFSPELLTCIKD